MMRLQKKKILWAGLAVAVALVFVGALPDVVRYVKISTM
jgi:hypothetical protein